MKVGFIFNFNVGYFNITFLVGVVLFFSLLSLLLGGWIGNLGLNMGY